MFNSAQPNCSCCCNTVCTQRGKEHCPTDYIWIIRDMVWKAMPTHKANSAAESSFCPSGQNCWKAHLGQRGNQGISSQQGGRVWAHATSQEHCFWGVLGTVQSQPLQISKANQQFYFHLRISTNRIDSPNLLECALLVPSVSLQSASQLKSLGNKSISRERLKSQNHTAIKSHVHNRVICADSHILYIGAARNNHFN